MVREEHIETGQNRYGLLVSHRFLNEYAVKYLGMKIQ